MQYNPYEPTTITEAAALIINALKRDVPRKKNVALFVELEFNNHFDEWYDNYPDFALITDTASSLETRNGTPERLEQDWQTIIEAAQRLEKKYLSETS